MSTITFNDKTAELIGGIMVPRGNLTASFVVKKEDAGIFTVGASGQFETDDQSFRGTIQEIKPQRNPQIIVALEGQVKEK
jgi:hypothetical protein